MKAPRLAAVLAVLLAVGAPLGVQQLQRQLRPVLQNRDARQARSLSKWLEDSRAGNQSRIRMINSQPERADFQLECRPHSPGFVPARSCSPPLHRHLAATEFLTVKRGSMGLELDDKESVHTAESGTVRIEPGVSHTWWNAAPEQELEIIVTFAPPTGQDKFFKSIYEFGQAWGSFDDVPPLQWFVTFDAIGMQPTFLPDVVWTTVIQKAIVPLAKWIGFKPFIADYDLGAVA